MKKKLPTLVTQPPLLQHVSPASVMHVANEVQQNCSPKTEISELGKCEKTQTKDSRPSPIVEFHSQRTSPKPVNHVELRSQHEATLPPHVELRSQHEATLPPHVELRSQHEATLPPHVELRSQHEATLPPHVEIFFKLLHTVLTSISSRYIIVHTQLSLKTVTEMNNQLRFDWKPIGNSHNKVGINYASRILTNTASSILDRKTLSIYYLILNGIFPVQWKVTSFSDFIKKYSDGILAVVIEELPSKYLYNQKIIEHDIVNLEKITPPKVCIPATIDTLMWVHELIVESFSFSLYSKILSGEDTSVKWYWIYKKIFLGPPTNLGVDAKMIHLWESIRNRGFFPKILKELINKPQLKSQ
jgi:hypothetical protein